MSSELALMKRILKTPMELATDGSRRLLVPSLICVQSVTWEIHILKNSNSCHKEVVGLSYLVNILPTEGGTPISMILPSKGQYTSELILPFTNQSLALIYSYINH